MVSTRLTCDKCGAPIEITEKDIRESGRNGKPIYKQCLYCDSWHVDDSFISIARNISSDGFVAKFAAHPDTSIPYHRPPAPRKPLESNIQHNNKPHGDSYYSRESTLNGGSNASGFTKFLIILAIIFMPYVGFFLVLAKKPFSGRKNVGAMVYCVIISVAAFSNMNSIYRNSTASPQATVSSVVSTTHATTTTKPEATTKPPATGSNANVLQGNYKPAIEDMLRELYSDDEIVLSDYVQKTDFGVDVGFWYCYGDFWGGSPSNWHSVSVRIGHNRLYRDGEPTLFYFWIDDERILWDEDNEDDFLRIVGY